MLTSSTNCPFSHFPRESTGRSFTHTRVQQRTWHTAHKACRQEADRQGQSVGDSHSDCAVCQKRGRQMQQLVWQAEVAQFPSQTVMPELSQMHSRHPRDTPVICQSPQSGYLQGLSKSQYTCSDRLFVSLGMNAANH